MITIIDHEYVGPYKMFYDVPVCSYLAEHELIKKGYKKCKFPQITTLEDSNSNFPLQIQLGMNILACCQAMMQNYTFTWKDLPLLFYAEKSLEGNLVLCPFCLVKGNTINTDIKDSENQKISLDLILEDEISII